MNVLFSDSFLKSLKKHSSLKEEIKRKVDKIIESPISLGEPLKGNFRGFYITPVKKNFLIIFLYCYPCRKKDDDKIVLCPDCQKYSNDTINFVEIGPHDKVYKRKDFI